MKTVLFPYHLENNEYCDIIVSAMEKNGIEVQKLSAALKSPIRLGDERHFNGKDLHRAGNRDSKGH